VLRGQQDVAQGDLIGAIAEYQKALDANRGSSLANYRLAEIFMMQKNYQSAANSFRDALRGDNDPKWTEVWSHVNLGKIFDITGQRERAVNEYRQAIQTNDNTQGAINEARDLMQHPYKRDVGSSSSSSTTDTMPHPFAPALPPPLTSTAAASSKPAPHHLDRPRK
jgi:tetratricopeptide (TPR) repeat protein